MRISEELKTTSCRHVYKRLKKFKDVNCQFCPYHRNENGHWVKPRKKKTWQLNPRRRVEKIKISSIC